MYARSRRCLLMLSLPVLLASAAAGAADITIYRCTDGQGRLTLRDTPCHKGERQQAQEMQRPRDPPKRPKAAATRAPGKALVATAAPATTTRYIVMTPPRPMYECVTPDGNSYLSETDEGNPRWMPLWALGYPVTQTRTSLGNNIGGRPGRPTGQQPGPPMPTNTGQLVYDPYGPGSWIRDACHALPQQEVCARLRDRRWELGRSYNSALQSERHQIDLEQRGIDARLDNDCGGA